MKCEIQIRGISLGCKHMNSDADQRLRSSELLDRVDCGLSGVPVPERRKPLGTLSLSLIQSLPRNRLGRNQGQDWVRMACVSHSINVDTIFPRCRLPVTYAWGETAQGVLSKDQNLKVKSFDRNFVMKSEDVRHKEKNLHVMEMGYKLSQWKCSLVHPSGKEFGNKQQKYILLPLDRATSFPGIYSEETAATIWKQGYSLQHCNWKTLEAI